MTNFIWNIYQICTPYIPYTIYNIPYYISYNIYIYYMKILILFHTHQCVVNLIYVNDVTTYKDYLKNRSFFSFTVQFIIYILLNFKYKNM